MKYYVNESGYYFNVTEVEELFSTVNETQCLELVSERTGLDIEEIDIDNAIYVTPTSAYVLDGWEDIDNVVEFCDTFEM